ncbi:MAG TPA: nitroreductase/quinone reductase family protein [Thermomicrobiales bacterium]|nr:nitroreductase/quinone reductase family protein [Thermomicrobiales bacterium]
MAEVNAMAPTGTLPRWLKPLNRVVVGLQRRGLAIGTMRVLTVQGRKSGRPHSTPVSTLTVDGRRYVVGGLIGADWVKNARAAGWGLLARGRQVERVALIELPEAERAPILRAFPREVPAGVGFFRRLYDLPADRAALPDAFAALAPRCAVFRVEPLSAVERGA